MTEEDPVITLFPRSGDAKYPEERQRLVTSDEEIRFLKPLDTPPKPRITYPQDWSAYNKAKTSEKDFFMYILDELLCYAPTISNDGPGRPIIPVRDQIFAMCLHQYNQLSSRRLMCDIKKAHKTKYMFAPIHFNTVTGCYRNQYLIKIIKDLIEITCKPLKEVEFNFAADSTGFGTFQFERWYDAKYGKYSNRRQFKKCHAMVGVKTNIVTAVTVTNGVSGDSPEFPYLVHRTAKSFTMDEVSADKAYSSKKNLNICSGLGIQPYIPFKKNVTGSSKGSMFWARMHRFFIENKEQFMQHYHKRSNVESTFSMIKQKTGWKLRTKSDISQTNEILIKCLIHNICVLIQEFFELGIDLSYFNICANKEFGQNRPN